MKLFKPKRTILLGLVVLIPLLLATVALAVFVVQSKVAGTTFSVGHPDLYLVKNSLEPLADENLTHTLDGFSLKKITPFWSENKVVMLYNAGDVPLRVRASAVTLHTTSEALNFIIFSQLAAWHDLNSNGTWEAGENAQVISDWQHLEQWSNSPVDIGVIHPGQTVPLVLGFKVDYIMQDFAGATTSIDINFDAIAE